MQLLLGQKARHPPRSRYVLGSGHSDVHTKGLRTSSEDFSLWMGTGGKENPMDMAAWRQGQGLGA